MCIRDSLLAPLASLSCGKWCKSNRIILIESKKAFYPSDSPKMGSLKDFYEEYKEIMHVPNLEVVSYPSPSDLPIEEVTQALQDNLSKIKTIR